MAKYSDEENVVVAIVAFKMKIQQIIEKIEKNSSKTYMELK